MRRHRRGGPPVARAEDELDGHARRRLLAAARELEPSGEHRVHDDPVPVEVQIEELAHARDARDPLAREGVELRRRAAHRERRRGAGRDDGTARERGVQRVGDDGEIGQLGHGERLYRRTGGARLARPLGTNS